MTEGFTIKSNARRAARRAGLDPDTLEFVQTNGLWTWVDPKVGVTIVAEILPPDTTAGADAVAVDHVGKSKVDLLVDMLDRKTGATVAEIAAFLEWQPHTARGRISDTAKKRGLSIITQTVEGRGRVYYVDRPDPRQEVLV